MSRALVAGWRLLRVLLHGLHGLAIVLMRFGSLPEARRHALIGWWSAKLLRLLGLRLVAAGTPRPGAKLVVANHVSWLDIELMHSAAFMCFVAKAEIERWPLIGWLAGRAGTIYHRRGSTHSLAAVMERVVERLRQGLPVGVFPEGGTGDGAQVRTFHARIFQVASDADVLVQPVALRYGRDGKQDPGVPFGKGESFFGNFVRLLGGPALEAEVHFCEPVALSDDGRRRTAEAARAAIVRALNLTETADHG